MGRRQPGALMNIHIKQYSLSTRFVVLLVGSVAMTAFSARSFYVRQERTDLQMHLQEKAAFINKAYSFLIADALIRKDDISLLQVVNSLEEEKDVISVVVVDQRDEIRYHGDAHKIGLVFDDPLVKNGLQTGQALMMPYSNSGGQALALVSPLKVPSVAQPLGAVRIDLTYRQI